MSANRIQVGTTAYFADWQAPWVVDIGTGTVMDADADTGSVVIALPGGGTKVLHRIDVFCDDLAAAHAVRGRIAEMLAAFDRRYDALIDARCGLTTKKEVCRG